MSKFLQHMRSTIFSAFVLILFLFMLGCSQVPIKSNSCDLDPPPPASYRVSGARNMATLVYPDPRRLADGYSGCITAWLEDNGKIVGRAFEAEFIDGRILWYKYFNLTCRYDMAKHTDQKTKNNEHCPPPEHATLKNTLDFLIPKSP